MRSNQTLAAALALGALAALPAHAAKVTECAKIGVCYCINEDLKATIATKVAEFRRVIAEQRGAGKAVGYLSIPLTSTGGGNFNVNREVAESVKAAVERSYGADFIWVLNSTMPEADLPKGSSGADYMLMWSSVLEGTDGLGDFDFVFFAGPRDFARYFGFDGNADMAKLDAFFDSRVKSDPEFAKAAQGGLTKAAFRKYYALRASSTLSRGAHDEWNIVRTINERRRAEGKLGTGSQIAMLFDGRAVAPPESEASVSDGYVGKCVP